MCAGVKSYKRSSVRFRGKVRWYYSRETKRDYERRKDKESRKTNVVVFELEKSYSDITAERKLHDRKAMEEIADVLQCSLKISNVIRMGKKIPKSTQGTLDI